jgi:hypothetical protein
MARPVPFRQVDLTRAVRGATNGGMTVDRIEIDPSGRIVLSALRDQPTPENDLDKWLKSHAG